ncbi:TPA: hypothetical protein ACNEGM_000210 [Escherichia coli]|uniref:hypothetical protein n=1 Tax=Escherichia coli TaxID=562 RepID=UPI000A1FC073|nr:hypothetical protein [Escherichia coli]HDW3846151.1 hypothetical protein [Escherichia coli O100:H12]EFK6054105.1 hypothetical protein [Escherichia coli]EGO3545163.1 hypothetical protein [Escherichia coli]EGO3601691.1 hypothetical protein [Escherichia coli]EJE5527000.1 hypothetical protein [Escherichia coli]
MSKIVGKTYENQKVILDGKTYEECSFVSCSIVYTGTGSIGLVNNTFIDCTWSFEGAAANTLQFLSVIYSDMGDFGRELVEATFRNIKSNRQ